MARDAPLRSPRDRLVASLASFPLELERVTCDVSKHTPDPKGALD